MSLKFKNLTISEKLGGPAHQIDMVANFKILYGKPYFYGDIKYGVAFLIIDVGHRIEEWK